MSTDDETSTDKQRIFAEYAQRTWIEHEKKLIEEFSKLAKELNLEVTFQTKLDFDIVDKSRQRLDQKVYRGMINYPRTHIR